ncbi:hypothetical protein DIPPA_12199 [Diplonema papillatum]|nr:hypothetical protein DIPPA_12199 [Diplonema papillatum]|eukprot:gene3786-5905_t
MAGGAIMHGRCYCGRVEFEYDTSKPIVQSAYCHCESCRAAHAAPLCQVIYVCRDGGAFRITSGEEHVKTFRKKGSPVARAFCTECGSRVYNDHDRTDIGLFPALLSEPLPESLRPTVHRCSSESILPCEDLADAIPLRPTSP